MPTTQKLDEDGIVGPDVPLGFASYLGVAVAVISGIAGIWAGIEGKNVEAASAAAVALIATFKTLDGRYAQAVEKIGAAAAVAGPWIEEAVEVLSAEEVPVETDESVQPPLGATDPIELDPTKRQPPQV